MVTTTSPALLCIHLLLFTPKWSNPLILCTHHLGNIGTLFPLFKIVVKISKVMFKLSMQCLAQSKLLINTNVIINIVLSNKLQ